MNCFVFLFQVKDRLKEKGLESVPIPSETLVRYQFTPGFQKRHSAQAYKSRFDLVSKIQRRQLRKFHTDAHYVNAYFL